ncbi:MAG: hypothetical protein ACFCGT_13275 [Sandaracinaceae bacterium]
MTHLDFTARFALRWVAVLAVTVALGSSTAWLPAPARGQAPHVAAVGEVGAFEHEPAIRTAAMTSAAPTEAGPTLLSLVGAFLFVAVVLGRTTTLIVGGLEPPRARGALSARSSRLERPYR